MKKADLARFDDIAKTADRYNSKHGSKRFYSIKSRDGKIVTIGMYDYNTKKYVLSKPFDDLNRIFKQIEDLIELPPKRK